MVPPTQTGRCPSVLVWRHTEEHRGRERERRLGLTLSSLSEQRPWAPPHWYSPGPSPPGGAGWPPAPGLLALHAHLARAPPGDRGPKGPWRGGLVAALCSPARSNKFSQGEGEGGEEGAEGRRGARKAGFVTHPRTSCPGPCCPGRPVRTPQRATGLGPTSPACDAVRTGPVLEPPPQTRAACRVAPKAGRSRCGRAGGS